MYGRTRTHRRDSTQRRASTPRLPLHEWRIRVHDKYPASLPWETFPQIHTRLADHYAAYDRHKTRGVPRPGKALLQGLVTCGACGPTMVVQYQGGTRYLCTALRQQDHVPVCQHLPADPIDARVVDAFFAALSPIELDVSMQAMALRQHQTDQSAAAHAQQVERLRYQVALCERQFLRVDPDNRLVAAALEQRWDAARHALKRAEEGAAHHAQPLPVPLALSAELRAAFTAIGHQLPTLWDTDVLSPPQRTAL